ncbi:MAG: hypothetical protein P8X67_19945 [Syntrophobacterales bacterium]|jgi:hypothetical protein
MEIEENREKVETAASSTLLAGQSFANSVTWENRRKNVLGFVEQSSFLTQLR